MEKVICIGSATKDIFISLKETKIIDTPEDLTAQKLMCFEYGAKIYAESFRENIGGSAVNVATGLELCGIKPFVFSRVSKSESGKWILKQLSKKNIKKNYIQKSGNVETEISLVLSDTDKDDHVVFRTGDSVELFDVEKALSKFKESVELIYVGSQKKDWKTSFAKMSEFAKEKSATLALNPSSYQIENHSPELIEILPSVDILFLNKDEAIELVQKGKNMTEEDVAGLGKGLVNSGSNIVVITDGKNGADLFSEKESFHAPSLATKVIDTTGAGDAFTSGFISAYVRQEDLADCLLWGLANSSGTVSLMGATEGLLDEQTIRKIVSGQRNLIQQHIK